MGGNTGGAGQWGNVSAKASIRAYDKLPPEARAVIREMHTDTNCVNVLEAWHIRQRRAAGKASAAAFAQECREAEARILAWATRDTYGPDHPQAKPQ